MIKSIHRVSVVVSRITSISSAVRVFHFKDKDNWELPPFSPGAHIDVHLPSSAIRQYSLCGDPSMANEYSIAVQREQSGRGGSRELHDCVNVGQELLISLPRNAFPFIENAPIEIIAGGIGITPFLSALPSLKARGQKYHLHYCVSSRESAPFIDWLEEAGVSSNFTLHESKNEGRLDIGNLISNLATDTHLYCCGPSSMIDASEVYAEQLEDRLHVEHFGINAKVDAAYEVKLARSGRVISVAEGQTMLQALRMADVHLPASCEAGVCLDCKCKWLKGEPLHQDIMMPESDRSQWITPCVSSCMGQSITLDL